MVIKSQILIFFLGVLLTTPNTIINFTLGGSVCNDRERKALLTFKKDLKDPENHLSSWGGDNEDCCGWNGVVCNNEIDDPTAVVVQLDLSYFYLSGDLNPSLQELEHLTHLDLSRNYFRIPIPTFLGSLQNLIYLDLDSGFVGVVPHQLGNLTNLIHLNIQGYSNELSVDGDLEWLSNLSSLQYLDMSYLNLSKASSNWFHSLNMLPSLLELHLRFCELDSIPSLSYVNFTSLEFLEFTDNQITSRLPKWLFNLTSLKKLDLNSNNFQGTIPLDVGDLTSLTELILSSNEFEGKVPRTLGNLCNLQRLDLSHNQLNGDISEFFQNSSGCIADSLEILDLSYNQLSGSISSSLGNFSLLWWLDLGNNNKFQGIVTELHFANLTNLRWLNINSVVLKLRPDWIPPFQIESLDLSNCHLGSRFPEWLRTQKVIRSLDLSDIGISGIVPTWFWNMSSKLNSLHLSHNHLSGELPDLSNSTLSGTISLRSNMFEGQLPRISPNVIELDISNNSITGPISALLCNTGEEMDLEILDLSRNLLSGELSECWSNWKQLRFINLESNAITGKIPISMGSLLWLRLLHLRKNSLYGELPSSLRNCTMMNNIDVGENKFTGQIPKWIGRSLSDLRFLSMRLNKLSGSIPQEFCHLSSLQLLDLAHNNLSGSIPRCFNNFSVMASKKNLYILSYFVGVTIIKETALLVTKGREFEYENTLSLFIGMDLSKNSLSGEIPEELTSLIALQSLNLSENYFTGKIPDKIGMMNSLESFDFSYNKLSGLIPQSMANMTFLSHLNLSYNNLSGRIPSGTQLQTFNESSYMGNQGLCGPPLLKKCNGADIGQPQGPRDDEDTEENEDWVERMKWFYVSMSLGLVTGFWGFWGVLLVKKSWRFAYFRFVGDMIDKLY